MNHTYPKPLSKKSIDKMLETWDPRAVEVFHKYYAAFSSLYGSIQLTDAWKIFKRLEPNFGKKQFMDFSSIVRREDVPYRIYEIDELYCDEKRHEAARFIINNELIAEGYYKFQRIYALHELQCGKPYYDKPDLLEVAAHPRYDKELISYINNMKFTKGEQKGKRFCEAVFLTKFEKFESEYYKGELKRQKVIDKALIPFSEKLMKEIKLAVELDDNAINSVARYFDEAGFEFETRKQADKFFTLLNDYNNKSHLWSNRGFSPDELYRAQGSPFPKQISLGPGIKRAFAEGQLDREELIAKMREMGIEVID